MQTNKHENIHFSKDIIGLTLYKYFLNNLLVLIQDEINDNSNTDYLIHIINLKNKIEKDIKGIDKRIEMIK